MKRNTYYIAPRHGIVCVLEQSELRGPHSGVRVFVLHYVTKDGRHYRTEADVTGVMQQFLGRNVK